MCSFLTRLRNPLLLLTDDCFTNFGATFEFHLHLCLLGLQRIHLVNQCAQSATLYLSELDELVRGNLDVLVGLRLKSRRATLDSPHFLFQLRKDALGKFFDSTFALPPNVDHF